MKFKRNSKNMFLLNISPFLLILVSIALYGCSLKHTGPKVVTGGVMFSVKVQNAKKVAIAGDFNLWDTEKDMLTDKDGNGIWSIVMPLADGRYEYIFLVNGGQWLLDPDVPFTDDGIGGKNSVITIKR
ncbi:MAG: hypothetical protein HY756_02300 [Nitrospirae bacterium]|nr:hypothetical protein [Nitrospirota bacterium]